MSTLRRESATRKRDAEGLVICSCGCGRPPGKGRRTWHSQECVDRWMWANSPQFVRQKLFERDRGICAMCGVDAERMRDRAGVLRSWIWHSRHGHQARIESFHRRHQWAVQLPKFIYSGPTRFEFCSPRVERARAARIAAMKADGWPIGRQHSWWEADHIVPVVEGGGQCGPDNYRTLCCRCHRVVTNQLRQRLKKAKGSVAPNDNKQAGIPEAGIGKVS